MTRLISVMLVLIAGLCGCENMTTGQKGSATRARRRGGAGTRGGTPRAAAGTAVAVLGCTHYPLVEAAFRAALPAATTLVVAAGAGGRQPGRLPRAPPAFQRRHRRSRLPDLGRSAAVGARAAVFTGAPCRSVPARLIARRLCRKRAAGPEKGRGMQEVFDVAILGASGYTGAELVRLIATHPALRIAALTADRKAGQPHGRGLPAPAPPRPAARSPPSTPSTSPAIDLAFCALPHATTQEVIASAAARPEDRRSLRRLPPARPGGLRALVRPPAPRPRPAGRGGLRPDRVLPRGDPGRPAGRRHRLQRRHRHLRHPAAAQGRRHRPRRHHHRPRHRRLRRRPLAQGRHAALRGLRGLPRLQRGQAPAPRRVRPGVRQGRRPQGRGDLRPAPPAAEPRHPRDHLRPRRRPRRSTRRSPTAYAGEPFIVVLPFGEAPATRHVRGSNFVHLGVIPDRRPGRAMVFSALDNLTKGSSGQAIQNANLDARPARDHGAHGGAAVPVRRAQAALPRASGWPSTASTATTARRWRATSPSRACCRSFPS